MGSRGYPPLEKLCAALSDFPRARDGDYDRDVHKAQSDVYDPEIAIVIDVHLPEGADIPDASVVRDESEPFREKTADMGETEPLSNN